MLAIVFLGMRLGLDWLLILIILEVSLEPFIIVWMRVVFTGEMAATEVEKRILQEQLGYEREIAEYRIQLAAKSGEVENAIRANKDFNDSNTKISEIDPETRKLVEKLEERLDNL